MDAYRTSFEQWLYVWFGLGGRPGSALVFEQIRAAYAEPHRAYHTLSHVEACLQLLDEVGHLASRPCEIAIALWFHDAIYDPHAADNEERSAEWATKVLAEHGAAPDVVKRVRDMILATRHNAATDDEDTSLLVDIDLSILGAGPPEFDRYDEQIRREYAWVPEAAYREARARVLRSFLERDAIYRCAPLHDRFEQQARSNLRRAIERLQRR